LSCKSSAAALRATNRAGRAARDFIVIRVVVGAFAVILVASIVVGFIYPSFAIARASSVVFRLHPRPRLAAIQSINQSFARANVTPDRSSASRPPASFFARSLASFARVSPRSFARRARASLLRRRSTHRVDQWRSRVSSPSYLSRPRGSRGGRSRVTNRETGDSSNYTHGTHASSAVGRPIARRAPRRARARDPRADERVVAIAIARAPASRRDRGRARRRSAIDRRAVVSEAAGRRWTWTR
jgi:hypothetical protein|tara:strand:+ start:3177 stop:3905 length:729 start_codon:yes stop_codon:yes gene_type:complete